MKSNEERIEKNFLPYFSMGFYKKLNIFLLFVWVLPVLYSQADTKDANEESDIELPIFSPDYQNSNIPNVGLNDLNEKDNDNKNEKLTKELKKINMVTPSGIILSLEIADTDVLRQLGLMFRKYLDRNSGMLFVFTDYKQRSFWMRNTSIPLSIAYVDEDGIVTQIEDMVPYSTAPVRSLKSAKFALEVNQGAFPSYGITVGTTLDLPADILNKNTKENSNLEN